MKRTEKELVGMIQAECTSPIPCDACVFCEVARMLRLKRIDQLTIHGAISQRNSIEIRVMIATLTRWGVNWDVIWDQLRPLVPEPTTKSFFKHMDEIKLAIKEAEEE